MFQRVAAFLAQHLKLSDKEFQYFVSFLQPRHFGRRERVAGPGDFGSFDLFIDAGCLRMYSVTLDGTDRNLCFCTEGSWWCHSATLASSGPLVVGIDALERTDLLLLEDESKERLCATSPKFDRLFRVLAQYTVGALQQRLVVSLENTAEARYDEFTRLYPELEARIPRYQVASFLGICPEFFSKLRRKRRSS